ncbi:hypothetical protein HMI55_004130 [Coelomomyces lativittatus]|nr:hypothetical protein HMI55_004130 [Coelomomyces lativittatus]
MVHSLKQDKLKLEKEVNGLHQLIQQLHMTIKEQEKLNRRIFTDLQGTQTSLRDLQTKYNDSLLLLQVKDEAIQIVQDEFTALQLELSTKEKENGLLKKENQRLTIHPPRIGVPSTYSTPSKSNEESSHPSGKKTNFHEANEMVVDQLHHLSISFKGAMKQFLETNHTHSNTTHAPLSTTESHGLSFPVSYEKEYASLMNKHKDDQVLPQSILKTWRVHEEEPLCLAVSLDGKWLATGGSDRYVKLWQSHLGKNMDLLTPLRSTQPCLIRSI